ncbi:hypothetical protein ERX46_13220 [Brumimicrobium glaciale]|uniref:Uncharacterized protein n=1 Tax=Brumimicrobium glaciale TaxID=200475 RepID=A0A4V1WFF4_9FLAO|nr:hypothetical protein [Brumimicrobium glaciale]RYM33006.1 hypothetical protein ERX46_13220 [Brumimicrobium glaciale]
MKLYLTIFLLSTLLIFISCNKVKEDSHIKNYFNEITQSCIKIQLGYFDLNAFKGDTNINWVRPRKITPQNNDSPRMYLDDVGSEIISFHNGMIK